LENQITPEESRINMEDAKFTDGTKRENIKVGLTADIVLKKDQRSGRLTQGVIMRILTKSPKHTHGIKVQLESGDVGRVKKVYMAE